MRLIIFDWDGTLMDSVAHIVASVQVAASETELAKPSPESIRNVVGLGLREALTQVFPGITKHDIGRFVDVYRRYFVNGPPGATALFPGVREVLQELRQRNYQLAVATGKGRRGLERELNVTDLHQTFDVTRCADETFSKPHPLMLEEILDELALLPEQALMVGDTEYDLEMAANANIRAIGVSWGVHAVSRLQGFSPLTILDSIHDLPMFLDEKFAPSKSR
ncbi:MAG: HAD-IA family hydrolase [Gammaproteobacteria bacterium]